MSGPSYIRKGCFYGRLIERNINQDRMDDYFLVHRLGIKEKLLYSVKNWKSKLAYEKIWYLGRIGKWQQSLEILINYLIRGNGLAMVAEENNASGYSRNVFDYLRSLRRKCKAMESWETGGKMLYDYATFKMIQVRDAEKEKKEEDELLQIVASFLDSVTNALLLEMVVSVQKVVQCLFTSAEIESSAKEQFYESLQQFFKIPIPPEYFEGLRKFIDANWSFIKDENISA
ncbi:hypothetical protein Ocin01_17264 [Orchesella cincta]|uniref:Uncharacterized protein n=1 Tax=Orchesella cincta TaxID=48709 RepID=A0A1D2M8W8_ORCCI|nr:hypothetical protein Ocin01_17264 [Orchesella cincta]